MASLQWKRLVGFENTFGRVIVVDDQPLVLEIMKQQFQTLNLSERLSLLKDGQGVINYLEKLLDDNLEEYINPHNI